MRNNEYIINTITVSALLKVTDDDYHLILITIKYTPERIVVDEKKMTLKQACL